MWNKPKIKLGGEQYGMKVCNWEYGFTFKGRKIIRLQRNNNSNFCTLTYRKAKMKCRLRYFSNNEKYYVNMNYLLSNNRVTKVIYWTHTVIFKVKDFNYLFLTVLCSIDQSGNLVVKKIIGITSRAISVKQIYKIY